MAPEIDHVAGSLDGQWPACCPRSRPTSVSVPASLWIVAPPAPMVSRPDQVLLLARLRIAPVVLMPVPMRLVTGSPMERPGAVDLDRGAGRHAWCHRRSCRGRCSTGGRELPRADGGGTRVGVVAREGQGSRAALGERPGAGDDAAVGEADAGVEVEGAGTGQADAAVGIEREAGGDQQRAAVERPAGPPSVTPGGVPRLASAATDSEPPVMLVMPAVGVGAREGQRAGAALGQRRRGRCRR